MCPESRIILAMKHGSTRTATSHFWCAGLWPSHNKFDYSFHIHTLGQRLRTRCIVCIVTSLRCTRPLSRRHTLHPLTSSKVPLCCKTRIGSSSKPFYKSFTKRVSALSITPVLEPTEICHLWNYSVYTDDPILDAADWAAVLHLATQWSFSAIRKLAILRLWQCSSDVDKVVYGHRYCVEAWLLPGYVALCERDEALTLEEGQRLEMVDVIAIMRAREALRLESPVKSASPSSSTTSTSSSSSFDRRVDLPCFDCRRFYVYTVSHWQTTVDCRFCCRHIPVSKSPAAIAKSTSSLCIDRETLQQKVKDLIPRHRLRYGVPSAVMSCTKLILSLSG